MAVLGFGELIGMLKKNPKKIVFTEGTDARILEAASRLLASNFLSPILVGDEEEIFAASEECGYNIRGAEIIDPKKFDRMDEMAEMFCELRKSKGVTMEQAKNDVNQAWNGGCPVRRSDVFYGRYGPSRITADQNKTGQQHRIVRIYFSTFPCYRR